MGVHQLPARLLPGRAPPRRVRAGRVTNRGAESS